MHLFHDTGHCIMAARFPAYLSKLTTIPRLASSSNKENKLKFSLRPRAKKGVQSEATIVELNLCTPVSKQKYCCVLCQSLLREPCQVTCCGSSYCKDCIDRLSATSGKCADKNCRKNYSVITDGAVVGDLGRKITQLKVYCVLKNSGCKWVGTIEELESGHFVGVKYNKDDIAACQFQYVNCPNECGTSVPRGKVTEHRFSECEKELSVCEYCGVEDSNIRKIHERMCPSVPVECPNKCAVPGIERSQILFHLENECPVRLVSCKYRHVGCEEQVRFANLNEHNITSYQKHLDLMSEKLVFVSNVNDELRGDNDNHQKNTTMLLSKLGDFQLGLTSAEDILGCLNDIKSTHSDNVYPASSSSTLSINTLIRELPQEEDGVSGYNSVIKELSSRISSQEEHETPPDEPITPEGHYMNIPARQRKGKVQAHDSVYELLPDVCADVARSQRSSEGQVLSPASDKPKRESSEPNVPGPGSSVKRTAATTSVPEKESNVELLGYRQFGSELSLPSISEEGNCNKSCPESALKHPKDGSVPRGVTFCPQVEVISDTIVDFGHEKTETTTKSPASNQQQQQKIPTQMSEEDDVFAPQVDYTSQSSTKIHGVDSIPVSKQHSDDVRSRSNVYAVAMRPRSMVISAPSFSSYNPKISETVRSRCHSSDSRLPLPPKASPNCFEPVSGINYTILSESMPTKVEPIVTEPPASDVGPTAVSVHSPEMDRRKIPTAPDSDAVVLLSSGFTDSSAYQAPMGSSRPEVSGSNSVSSRGEFLPSQDRHFSIPASTVRPGTSRPLHHSREHSSTNSLPIHDMGDVQKELSKVFGKRSSVLMRLASGNTGT